MLSEPTGRADRMTNRTTRSFTLLDTLKAIGVVI